MRIPKYAKNLHKNNRLVLKEEQSLIFQQQIRTQTFNLKRHKWKVRRTHLSSIKRHFLTKEIQPSTKTPFFIRKHFSRHPTSTQSPSLYFLNFKLLHYHRNSKHIKCNTKKTTEWFTVRLIVDVWMSPPMSRVYGWLWNCFEQMPINNRIRLLRNCNCIPYWTKGIILWFNKYFFNRMCIN